MFHHQTLATGDAFTTFDLGIMQYHQSATVGNATPFHQKSRGRIRQFPSATDATGLPIGKWRSHRGEGDWVTDPCSQQC